MTTSTVHIVEDEPLHAALLDRALRRAGFGTWLSTDGPSGWRDIQGRLPALVLLDLMLPGLSGQEICRMVRHNTATRHIPIIMLTAVGGDAQRITGLDMGADDYVEKPFSSSEVVSRVRAVLRRSDPSTVEAGPVLNPAIRMQGPYSVVLIGTREVTVSRKEAHLLDVLLDRENTLLGAEVLIGIPGGEGSEVMLRELDRDVRSLRRKLENNGAGSIEVLPGFRYRLKSGR